MLQLLVVGRPPFGGPALVNSLLGLGQLPETVGLLVEGVPGRSTSDA